MTIEVRRRRRSDPDAPLLILLHEDGEEARSGIQIGRRLWPGAPLASLRGRYTQGKGWRHLSEPATRAADLGLEGRAVAQMAQAVMRATSSEPSLVEVVGIGVGGGADAATALLCRHPTLFAAAVLCRPCRHWVEGFREEVERGNGVEVLIVAEAAQAGEALKTKEMLSLAGHRPTIRLTSRADEIAATRAWIWHELRGDGEDGD